MSTSVFGEWLCWGCCWWQLRGPWIFDLIVVPSEYSCSTPAIRLEGDYCGIPMPGTWILLAMAGRLVNMVVGLETETVGLPSSDRAFLLTRLLQHFDH